MKTKALITGRSATRTESLGRAEVDAAERTGARVEHRLSHGTLVRGDEGHLAALEKQGFRVKRLPDPDILDIGSYRIDVTKPPAVPPSLEVPSERRVDWTHHLVQLDGPRSEEWIRAIEARGVDVVEPLSRYGLFVIGAASDVEKLRELPYVRWTSPMKPAYRLSPTLRGRSGLIKVAVDVAPADAAEAAIAAITALGGKPTGTEVQPTTFGGALAHVTAEIDAARLPELAAQPAVRWIEHLPPFVPLGEREVQIMAENLDAAAPPATGVVTGYQAWLTSVGLDGGGVTIAIADTGVDANANNNTVGHTDLRGRQTAFIDYTGGASATDTHGHGTHVAGIAFASAATGQTEAAAPANFLWGQGMAPQANFVTQSFLLAAAQPSVTTLIRDAVQNGAQVMNNSWGVDDSGGSGYSSDSRTIDLAVRDPNSAAAGLEYLVIVCAAGNEGGRATSIGRPHESKNDIVVGNSLTSRPGVRFPSDDIEGISGTSSRGPAVDGRILPTVVAPGTDVSSLLSRTSTAYTAIPGTGSPDPSNPAVTIDQYTYSSGTSMSAPHVTGACALLIQWWQQRTGRRPSPALVKALLINGAEDIAGGQNWHCLNRVLVDKTAWSLQSGSIYRRTLPFTPVEIVQTNTPLTQVAALANIAAAGQWAFDSATSTLYVRMTGSGNPGVAGANFLHARDAAPVAAIPNGDQGWGRVSLENILLQSPSSDRGPKIFSDQRHAFIANGQEHVIRVAPVDAARPLRITLVWTDAAAAAGSNPALVNDLDLEVVHVATGTVYRGNVFSGGFSTAGGSFDSTNNVECVYLQAPSGTYEVRVIAAGLSASARPDDVGPWQDFALVIDNAEVPDAAPVGVVPVIDRSGSMISFGYVDTTRTSSKQFIDLLGIDDAVGLVSFGSTASIDYQDPGGGLQTITGQPIRDAAKAQVDGLAFGGCTYMGQGIQQAAGLLSGVAGARAMVLLSDGYDNKGCDAGNPAKPSALDAVAGLPAALPVFSCAMGPLSDQALLQQIADATDGRYYYMPTIDDLFEIYNYIRGQVTGDSLVVNTSASASTSSVDAFVDAEASRAVFTVAWADTRLRYHVHEPKGDRLTVRLYDPKGRRVHANASFLRRTVGDGYVAFELHEPAAGRWKIEVATDRERHLRYTVGGFVRSPIRLQVAVRPERLIVGGPLTVVAQVAHLKLSIGDVRAAATVTRPVIGVPDILSRYGDVLRQIKPRPMPDADTAPLDITKIAALREQMLAEGRTDLFARAVDKVRLEALARSPRRPPIAVPRPIGREPEFLRPNHIELVGKLRAAPQAGSYNVAVVAVGLSPRTGTRFVRQELASVLVR